MKNRERQRANRRREGYPNCPNNQCASYRKGVCIVLASNDFGTRACPFFKTTKEAEMEREASLERLVGLGRHDLIRKYKLKVGENNGY